MADTAQECVYVLRRLYTKAETWRESVDGLLNAALGELPNIAGLFNDNKVGC